MKNKIKKELKQLTDEKYRKFHSGLCPGTENILGVRVPVLRKYAKELIKKYEWKELLENIDDEYYEEIMLQGMLIGLAKEDIEIILLEIRDYIPKINNWAICDIFCAGLKITKKYPEKMWKFIQKYLQSDKEFEIRFAVVIMLDYYINDEYEEKVIEILDGIKCEKYYVQMAIAWTMSVCLIKYYDKTIKYLQSNKCHLDKFTFNKSIQKAIESYRILDEKKDFLRNLKR